MSKRISKKELEDKRRKAEEAQLELDALEEAYSQQCTQIFEVKQHSGAALTFKKAGGRAFTLDCKKLATICEAHEEIQSWLASKGHHIEETTIEFITQFEENRKRKKRLPRGSNPLKDLPRKIAKRTRTTAG